MIEKFRDLTVAQCSEGTDWVVSWPSGHATFCESKEEAEEIRTAYRETVLGVHRHRAGTTIGRPLDECAICGIDFRDPIHARA